MNATTESHHTNGKASKAEPTLAAVREVPLSLVDESKTNPRKTFVHVEELAADVAQHGILQNLLLRPKAKGRFEVVFGARRFRAAKLAKLETIPAVVRELDDAKALELQIVENSHREDVHPLEEADGYQTLHEKHGYSVDEIAAKVGKSTAHVYARLKFAALIPEAREAFFGEKLSAASALLVARIPHAELQKKALAEITKPSWNGDLPSLAEAKRIVKERFTLRIVDAPFDRADADLVEGAPACTGCPKRTGNQKELFADLETKDDLCTDPKCFESKRGADAERKIAAAREAGQEVIIGRKAKDLFSYGSLKQDSGFIDLSAQVWDGEKSVTNAAKLKKAKADLPIVLAKDPDGKLRELVDAKAFAKATKSPVPKDHKPTKAELRRQEEAEKERKKDEREQAKMKQRELDVVEKAERRQPNDSFWRTLARLVMLEAEFALEHVLERRGLLPTDESELAVADYNAIAHKAIATMTGPKARGLAIELLVAGRAGGGDAALLELEQLYGTAKKPIKRKR